MSEKNPKIARIYRARKLRPLVLSDKEHSTSSGTSRISMLCLVNTKDLSVSRWREARLRPEHGFVQRWPFPTPWELAAVVVDKDLDCSL